MTRQNAQSITPFNTFTASPQIDGTDPQRAPLHVVSRGQSRASNDALAWLAVQDVTPGVHDFGVYLAKMARFATTADGRRKATAGEVMCYPLQKTMAKERGCSVRQIKRLVRSLREVGLEVRQRVRPYGATYVFPVPSDVPSDVPSQREPRTEPRTEKKERTVSKLTNFPSKRADTGQTQGIGKSALLLNIFPPEHAGWMNDGLHLAADPKVRAEALLGRVVVEAGEMAGSTRADLESLKAFVSRQDDGGVRLAFRRNPEPAPRRCIIVGTSNRLDVLPNDPTGNRRFVPVVLNPPTQAVEGYLTLHRDQLWYFSKEAI